MKYSSPQPFTDFSDDDTNPRLDAGKRSVTFYPLSRRLSMVI